MDFKSSKQQTFNHGRLEENVLKNERRNRSKQRTEEIDECKELRGNISHDDIFASGVFMELDSCTLNLVFANNSSAGCTVNSQLMLKESLFEEVTLFTFILCFTSLSFGLKCIYLMRGKVRFIYSCRF